MPIWVTELARWLGLTADAKRPNLGALLLGAAVVLYSFGYRPEDVSTFGEGVVAMLHQLLAFVQRPDNLIATALGGTGLLMSRGRNGTDLSAEEVAALRAALAARRPAPPPVLEVDP